MWSNVKNCELRDCELRYGVKQFLVVKKAHNILAWYFSIVTPTFINGASI